MSISNKTKKPAEQNTLQDWHTADIKAALEKAGWTLRRLSEARGVPACSLRTALQNPWPKAEAHIAAAIGTTPQTIWPARYRADGTPRSGYGERVRARARARKKS